MMGKKCFKVETERRFSLEELFYVCEYRKAEKPRLQMRTTGIFCYFHFHLIFHSSMRKYFHCAKSQRQLTDKAPAHVALTCGQSQWNPETKGLNLVRVINCNLAAVYRDSSFLLGHVLCWQRRPKIYVKSQK